MANSTIAMYYSKVGDKRMTITDKVLVPREHSSRDGSKWYISKQGDFRFRWGMGWPGAIELAFYEDSVQVKLKVSP